MLEKFKTENVSTIKDFKIQDQILICFICIYCLVLYKSFNIKHWQQSTINSIDKSWHYDSVESWSSFKMMYNSYFRYWYHELVTLTITNKGYDWTILFLNCFWVLHLGYGVEHFFQLWRTWTRSHHVDRD